MDNLIQRLNDAEERSVIINILLEVEEEILRGTDCTVLLESIIYNTSKISNNLTTKEVSRQLDSLIYSANPLHSIVVLVDHLIPSDSVNKIIVWLRRILETLLKKVLIDSVNVEPCKEYILNSFSRLVSSLVSIQDRLHNLKQHVKEPHDVVECIKTFEIHIHNAITSSLEYAFKSLISGRDINLTVLSMLIAKGRNIYIHLLPSTILEYTTTWLCSKEYSPLWDRISQRLFTDDSCGSREFEAMVVNIITIAKSEDNLMRCFGYTIKRSPCLKRICTTKMLLQRICRPEIPGILAGYIHLAGGKEMFIDTLKTVLTVWSDPGCIKYSSIEQQKYLTRIVLEFTRRINAIDADHSWPSLFTFIIRGVQERLGNADLTIRQSGMFVGESCSGWMQGNQLTFDYIDDIWLTEMKRIVSGVPEEPDNSILHSTSENVIEPVLLHPSSKVQDFSNKLDSDDEEDFAAYYIPDSEKNIEILPENEEPEKSAPALHYIHDCWEKLSEKDKYEIFESALFSLEAMIRRRAIGFDDIASKLLTTLVFVDNRFNTKDFEATRKSCLVACLVMKPQLAPQLCDTMFSRRCAFYHRYIILESLLDASKELSSQSGEQAVKKVDFDEKYDTSSWQAVVNQRIRAKTRWFTNRKKEEPSKYTSRFANVATLFFYPLLRSSTEEHLELKGRDAPFLARILFTAGEILQCASTSPSIVKMSIFFCDFITTLRFHDEPVIISAVLFCYLCIATAVSDSLFPELFGNAATDWVDWAMSLSSRTNSSEHDRTMVRHFVSVLLEKMKIDSSDLG